MTARFPKKFVFPAVLLTYILLLLRTAWISDDAKITFRCILNLVHGYGPNFNVSERVQAYTHPLWFLILSVGAWLGANIFYFAFALSMSLSILVVFLILQESKNQKNSWIWICALLFSKAFIDFSTSGLENPLSHLMIFVGFWSGLRFFTTQERKFARIALITLQTMYLCRPDLILIGVPFSILILHALRTRNDRIQMGLLSISPMIVWTLFSLIYYGFPFPNTAYAKLNNHVPQLDLLAHGGVYFWDSLVRDPITLLTIIAGLIMAVRGKREMKMIGLGIALYLFYILWIGGDFMAGRFLTAPLVAVVFILIHSPWTQKELFGMGAGVVLTGVIPFFIHLSDDQKIIDKSQPMYIVDERSYWFEDNGLISPAANKFRIPSWELGKRTVSRTCGNLGKGGFEVGPSNHIIDLCGLADPLTARLPPKKIEYWRVGHFFRQMPTNYEMLMDTGDESTLVDQPTLAYWRVLKTIVQGPIFTVDRFKTILKINLGMIDKPDFHMYETADIPSQLLPLWVFQQRKIPTQEKMAIFRFIFSIQFYLGKPTTITSIDTSILSYSDCDLQFLENGNIIGVIGLEIRSGLVNRFHNRMPQPIPNVTDIKVSCKSTEKNPIPRAGIGHFFINR